ncbi:MAG: DUF3367 domain-containing protein, partial [Acidimicrobiales bacterium]|nr:DUF3367 domain-containing protein [Acidimicrobiales bacterium]
MEPGPVDVRERAALLAASLAVGIGLLAHEPGRIVPETKLDVLIDPGGAAARALGAWDPSAGFGRLQNQAVGYLFPMGAWSGLGKAVGLPPWIVQRLWLWAVVSVSLWGAHRVARAIGIASAGGRVCAAVGYALAPATFTITFFQSAGQLPYALVPHVLAELMAARAGASPRRAAARSTLWLAAMGGVNGASAIAVLPIVGLWFWTRTPGRDRRRLLGWWSLGAVLATLWWAIPLLVTVRYGLRFTDYTETAATTTITESATEVLRGTGNWLSYVDSAAGAWLPGSWAMVSTPLSIAATSVLAAVGIGGLARRDAPERTWAVACVLVGAVAMGAGWAGTGGGPFSGLVQQVLDGTMAPLRNVHKFAAVVRLPLALGLGHLVAVAGAALARRSAPTGASSSISTSTARRPRPQLAAPALAVAVAVAAILPAIDAGLTAPGSFEDVPDSWRQAAAWIDRRDDGARTLVLPGSAFGEYRWGRPLDEPLASILESDWAVRDLIPLGGNGSTRLLDGIDAALATDALPEGFVATLQRAGIGFVLVRNDLDLVRTGGPAPTTVRRLLGDVEGLELATSFGPIVDVIGGDGRRSPLPGTGEGGAASEAMSEIDVYRVERPDSVATTYPAEGALVVGGGPEALLGAPDDLTDGRAVVLAVDDPGTLDDPMRVATDTARRRDVEFNVIRDGATETLTADEASPRTGDAPQDRWPGDGPVGLTVARLDGVSSLRDSGRRGLLVAPESQPYAAFDDDPDTAWEPQGAGVGEWLEVTFDEPRDPVEVEVDVSPDEGRRITELAVRTDRGMTTATVGEDGSARARLRPGSTSSLRIEVTEVSDGPALGRVGIAEVRIDGASIGRPLVAAPAGTPTDGAPSEVGVDAAVLVRARRDRLDRDRRDEDGAFERIVDWAGGDATVTGTATIGDTQGAIDQLLTPAMPSDATVVATASSRYRDALSSDAMWVLDGDPATAWVSDAEEGAPMLTVSWERPVLLDGFRLDLLASDVTPIQTIEVDAGGTTATARLDATGRVSLPSPVTTDQLSLRFPDAAGGGTVGVAGLEVPALSGMVAAVLDRGAAVGLPCGSGPEVSIDGNAIPTQSSATVADLVAGRAVRWEACDTVSLEEGTHRLHADRGALFASSIVVRRASLPDLTPARSATVVRWGTQDRTVHLGAGPESILATTENLNAGW